MFIAETKKLDKQGRVILPKEWRKEIEEVKIIRHGKDLIIRPKNKKSLLDVGPIEVDLESPLDDWHAVKAELLGDDV